MSGAEKAERRAETFEIEGATLRAAITNCFERRGTTWAAEIPNALRTAFYSDADLHDRWRAYQRAGRFRTPPPEAFEEIDERLRAFLGPVRESIVAAVPFDMLWPAGGSWRPGKYRGEGGEGDD